VFSDHGHGRWKRGHLPGQKHFDAYGNTAVDPPEDRIATWMFYCSEPA